MAASSSFIPETQDQQMVRLLQSLDSCTLEALATGQGFSFDGTPMSVEDSHLLQNMRFNRTNE